MSSNLVLKQGSFLACFLLSTFMCIIFFNSPFSLLPLRSNLQVFGMKLLVCWLLGLQSDQEKASHPVLRLLDTVLAHDGDLQGDDNVR